MNAGHPPPQQRISSRSSSGAKRPGGGPWPRRAQIAWCALVVCLLGSMALQVRQALIDVHSLCVGTDCEGAHLSAPQVHALHHAGISVDIYGAYVAAIIALLACVYCAVAAIIIWHRPGDRMAVITAFILALFGGLAFDSPTHPPSDLPSALWLAEDTLVLVTGYGMLAFLLLFPSGKLPLRWPLLLTIPWVAEQTGEFLTRHSHLPTSAVPTALSGASWVLMSAAVLSVQIHRYRFVSNPVERQQTKWAVFGISGAIIGFLGFAFYPLASMTGNTALAFAAFPITQLAGLLIPISIGVAILQYHLWDVDVLINRALVYGPVTVSLALVYVGGVLALQTAFRGVTGQHSDLAVAITTLVIVGLFNPLRRSFQALVDRRFYRRKYDATRTLAALQSRLRDDVDLDRLSDDLTAVVQETMQPTRVSLWLR